MEELHAITTTVYTIKDLYTEYMIGRKALGMTAAEAKEYAHWDPVRI